MEKAIINEDKLCSQADESLSHSLYQRDSSLMPLASLSTHLLTAAVQLWRIWVTLLPARDFLEAIKAQDKSNAQGILMLPLSALSSKRSRPPASATVSNGGGGGGGLGETHRRRMNACHRDALFADCFATLASRLSEEEVSELH